MIKTRFAPSPTGPMHLGDVRTALFNHCLACRPLVGERVPERMRPAFVEAIRANVLLPADALLWAGILYGDDIEISDAAARMLAGAASGFFDEALEICGRLAGIEALAGELKTRLALSRKALFLPLRAALTGRIDGPDLADLIALMPRERVRERFAAQP